MQPLDVTAFFQAYLAFFVVILFYIAGWLWKRKAWLKVSDIDIDSGRRELDWDAIEKLKTKRQNWPAWRRVLDKLF